MAITVYNKNKDNHFKRAWQMSTDWIIALSAMGGTVLGGIITAIIKATSSNNASSILDSTRFRRDILQRIESLEKKQDKLQTDLEKWKNWYWSLYYWLVELVSSHKVDIDIPKFHEQEKTDK